MIILDQKVIIKWNGKHKKFYQNLGYKFTKLHDEFEADLKDVPIGSNVKIQVVCDFCGSFFESTYKRMNKITKHTCHNCCSKKIKETWLNKYGVTHPMKTTKTKEKLKNTWLKNYGVDHNMKNKEVRNKMVISTNKTLYKNGSALCSKQQKYLYNLLGGELNYPIDLCRLDIAFLDKMIYIEYDGGGHGWWHLANGKEKEFRTRERHRKNFLNSKGWKLIRIISKADKMYEDNKIISLIKECEDYLLNSNHTWIEIDIDNNQLICSQFTKIIS